MVDQNRQLKPSELHARQAEMHLSNGKLYGPWNVRADDFAQANAHATLALYYQSIGK